MRLRDAKRFARALTIVAGCLLAIAAGFACLRYSFAEPLTRTSYDLPFVWRTNLDTHEIVLVYLDEESAKQLNQPIDDVWNRTLHVPLLDRLTRDGARLVFYDIVFDTPSPDPSKDDSLRGRAAKFRQGDPRRSAGDRATDGRSETGAGCRTSQALAQGSGRLGPPGLQAGGCRLRRASIVSRHERHSERDLESSRSCSERDGNARAA